MLTEKRYEMILELLDKKRSVTGESVREISERCERDARRYDGGFPLY